VDVSFQIGDYLGFHRVRKPRRVESAAETGWFRLAGSSALFRLPTAGEFAKVGKPWHHARAPPIISAYCVRRIAGISRIADSVQ
jgi:hypothetical protein